ncbi:tyrosine-type recombinase/integrase [Metaclostridioides mangenotii]|uniref:tyrosine-type recombinase/integrase n=1 Tax=Metaclostridioides mangenotii TaxID=1540 RepID=UPI0028E99E8E|nr:tyrosine-type recombinase/integrase [Clostridioides mangenotii]
MAKRANGEGSIGKYKNGWRSKINIGYDEDGKVIRKEFYGKTQKEVKEKLDEFRKNNLLDYNIDNDKLTLAQWFYIWLWEFKKREIKPNTFDSYHNVYKNYIDNNAIGNIELKKFRNTHLQKYYNNLYDNGLNVSTIKHINKRLKTCLNEAYKQGYIDRNYCSMVTLPKDISKEQRKTEVLTLEQQQRFIDAIKGHKLEVLFLVAISTGLRRGELLGLKWSDIDFDNCSLTVHRTLQKVPMYETNGNKIYTIVEHEPKTDNSIRTIPLPNDILIRLREYKKEQNTKILKMGELYQKNDYVFADDLGQPINHQRPKDNLRAVLKKLDIEPIKFHGLRKTYATRLFENDVPPKTVQALMGHSDISITMNIYTEVMEEKKYEAVNTLNNIFRL